MVPTTPYECFVTALLCASCATLILLDSASVYALLDKLRLYVAGFLRAARAQVRLPVAHARQHSRGPDRPKRH